MKRLLAILIFGACGIHAEAQQISQLPAGSSVSDTDLFPATQGYTGTLGTGATKKITAVQLKAYMASAYTLPVATTLTLGGVKQGANVSIAGDGTISIPSLSFSLLTGTPTTLSGYGITDPVVLTSGSYSNPSWITSMSYTKITGRPFGGTQAIASGADTVTVTGLGLSSAPSLVVVTTQKLTGNLNLFATVRSDSITSNGFTCDLSAATDGNTYTLTFIVIP